MTQDTRQAEILRPACKELLRIEDVRRIPELIRRAFLVATSGRPGPVVVAVPEDVCHGTLPFDEEEFAVDARCEAAPPSAAGRPPTIWRGRRSCWPVPSGR